MCIHRSLSLSRIDEADEDDEDEGEGSRPKSESFIVDVLRQETDVSSYLQSARAVADLEAYVRCDSICWTYVLNDE